MQRFGSGFFGRYTYISVSFIRSICDWLGFYAVNFGAELDHWCDDLLMAHQTADGAILRRVNLPGGIILRRVSLPGVSYPGESFVKMCVEISPKYHTSASQSPQGIILHRVILFGVSYCAESISPGYHTATHDPGESTAISLHFCTGL